MHECMRACGWVDAGACSACVHAYATTYTRAQVHRDRCLARRDTEQHGRHGLRLAKAHVQALTGGERAGHFDSELAAADLKLRVDSQSWSPSRTRILRGLSPLLLSATGRGLGGAVFAPSRGRAQSRRRFWHHVRRGPGATGRLRPRLPLAACQWPAAALRPSTATRRGPGRPGRAPTRSRASMVSLGRLICCPSRQAAPARPVGGAVPAVTPNCRLGPGGPEDGPVMIPGRSGQARYARPKPGAMRVTSQPRLPPSGHSSACWPIAADSECSLLARPQALTRDPCHWQ